MSKKSIFISLSITAGLFIAMWAIGLVLFVTQIASYIEPPISDKLEPTDAIVVLTGGSERVHTGINLLAAYKGRKLLISGVHPSVGAKKILSHTDLPQQLKECCVVLGHQADNTLGNAEEARAFMKNEGFQSLRLVTSHYHMPRSLVFFRKLMPDVRIIPHPVSPDVVSLSDWWQKSGTAMLLIGEYDKYLYAWLRAVTGAM